MTQLILDYLIVGYLTLIAGWKVSLPILALLSLFLLYRKKFIMAAGVFACLAWIALAAWQFTLYLG